MGTSITGIPTTRVTAMFTREQLLRQTQYNQFALSILEQQLSSGYAYQVPSEDPIAAMQTISLQRLIQRKDQVKTNLETTQSYLGATDTSLSTVSNLVIEARATTLGVVGTTYTDTQRKTAAQQIEQTIQQLMNIGNQQFRGRYLFSGSDSLVAPFVENSAGMIEYLGNDQHLMSYSDLNLLTSTNVTGNEAFGVISAEVKGTKTIIPNLTYDTLLSDLRQGQGISKGSIAVSDGTKKPDGSLNETVIDLSSAKTIGDIAALIKANPPAGRQLNVDIINEKIGENVNGTLKIQLNPSPTGGNLIIREVGSGTVAEELGIRNDTGSGMAPIVGRPLQPILRTTTNLDDMFGAYPTTVVHCNGTDNDVRFTGDVMGTSLDNINIVYLADNTITGGYEYLDPYTPGDTTVTIHVAGNGSSQAKDVIAAVNHAHDFNNLPFTATIDRLDNVYGGLGYVTGGVSASTGNSGYGEHFDKTHGLQIVNNGKEQNIDFSLANTLGDVLNILNGANAGVLAEINATHNGINLLSKVSGCDLEIGENGGKTAFQFGVRSLSDATALDKLNYGDGVNISQNSTDIMANTTLVSAAANANIKLTAKASAGDPQTNYWNDFSLSFQNTGDNPPTVVYDKTKRTIIVGITSGTTTANDVIKAVNTSDAFANFTASIANNTNGTASDGSGKVSVGTAITSGGTAAGNDFTITRTDGVELYVDIAQLGKTLGRDLTVQDIIDSINHDPKNIPHPTPTNPTPGVLTARLNQYGNGIELVDECGGTGQVVVTKNTFSNAAIDLGLVAEGKTTSATPAHDHSVKLADPLDPQTGVVIHGRNSTAPIAGVKVEFVHSGTATTTDVNYSANSHTLTVTYPTGATANDIVAAVNGSTSSVLFQADLAPIPNDGSNEVEDFTTDPMWGSSSTKPAQIKADFTGYNNGMVFTATQPGYAYEGVQIQFVGTVGGTVHFDHVGNIVTVNYDSTPGAVTTAKQITDAWSDPANWPLGDNTLNELGVKLDPDDGTPNLGTGLVVDSSGTMTEMTTGTEVISGKDVNPQETQGIFTALLRIRDALMANDQSELTRAVKTLDDSFTNLNYTRADLGAREQGLELTQDHLASENIDLETALSENHDVDFVQVVSDLTARQTAYQASLMSLGKIMQISLLNYL